MTYRPSLWRAPGAAAAAVAHGLKGATLALAQWVLFRRPRQDARRVAIYRIGSIGDLATALPVMQAIVEHHRGAKISLITNDGPGWPKQLGLDRALGLDVRAYRDVKGLRDALREVRPDALYYLSPSPATFRRLLRDTLFFAASGVRRALGFDAPEPCRLTAKLLRAWMNWPNQTRRLLLACRLAAPAHAMALTTAAHALADRPLAVLAPTGKFATQHWPEQRYLEIATRLTQRGYAIAWLGDETDAARLAAAGLPPTLGVNHCGRLDLAQSAAILRGAAVVIANDSGLAHLAARNDAPLVVICSARNVIGSWTPWRKRGAMTVLRTDMNCEGCGLRTCGDTRCLAEISVEQVWAAIEKVLDASPVRSERVAHPEPVSP